ncbi:hypothetical protein ASV26_08165 [Klebsiella aerogenes]|nr:hypothetical protein ASV26_08165 [Klebsiella aerogenes]
MVKGGRELLAVLVVWGDLPIVAMAASLIPLHLEMMVFSLVPEAQGLLMIQLPEHQEKAQTAMSSLRSTHNGR